MKKTVWHRLTITQFIFIGLLMAGMGLVMVMEKTRSDADKLRCDLERATYQIRYHQTQMSDAARGLMIDPHNENEKKRRRDAEQDLLLAFDTLMGSPDWQAAIAKNPQLGTQLKSLREFSLRNIVSFHNRITEMLTRDPASVPALYAAEYYPLRQQRDSILSDLLQKIDEFTSNESQHAERVSWICMGCLFVVMIGSIYLGIKQSAAVTGPLSRLVASLERMRQGDFTQRIKLPQRDEFGTLGNGLDRLADDLSGLVGQVQRSGIQVNTTATEIAATAKEQQSTANEIAATTAEIGATSKEISATSKELVKTMNEVAQVAEDTTSLANSGQNAITRMETNMRTIMEASGSITNKLAVLNEKTANINTVVTTITKVADQTNLLSLNAAIEAEKAGEYGLGFAVVAMEIRRLADQTAVATYDIEKMVKEMQSAVAAGVMGMDKFSEEVRRGVEEIRQVSAQLAQIIQSVQTLTPRFQTVNEGMHAQATGAQQISETLTQLSEAAHQTADSLRQSNMSIEQLNDAARGLQTSVAKFRLEG